MNTQPSLVSLSIANIMAAYIPPEKRIDETGRVTYASRTSEVLEAVAKNPRLNPDEYAAIVGIHVSTVRQMLTKLHREGKVKRMRPGSISPFVYWATNA